MGFLDKLFGSYSDRELKRIYPIAEAIEKLYDDPALRVRLGKAAREKVEGFTAQEVEQKMREIYLDTLGTGDWGL